MTCERISFPNPRGEGPDVEGIICSRGKRWPRCSVPGCDRRAPFLCDFPIPRRKSGTCDAKLCDGHRARQGEDRDFCPPHAKHAQGSLPL
jgi:hypothetical protein